MRDIRSFLSGPLSAIFLLSLYLAGNVQFETFHDVVHSLEQSLHSAEQESDPCHRAIYHEVKNDGCDHQTHFTEIEQCPLCHVVPINAQHLEASHSFECIQLPNDFGKYSPARVAAWDVVDVPARAPPVV